LFFGIFEKQKKERSYKLLAHLYLQINKKSEVLDYIEEMVNKRIDWDKIHIQPGFEKLHSEPRYNKLMKRIQPNYI
jgi:hypothetical protein